LIAGEGIGLRAGVRTGVRTGLRVSDEGELLLPVLVLHESTVKATFNAPCKLSGSLSGEEAGVLYEKSWGINSLRGVENSLLYGIVLRRM